MPERGADGRFIPNPAGVAEVLRSRDGVVGRMLAVRCIRVTAEAKRLCPVNHGRLRGSIRWRIDADAKGPVGIVGTDVEYAIFVHEGTTAHGIDPVNAQALWWEGAQHPVAHVNHPGTKGTPFLRDALRVAIV